MPRIQIHKETVPGRRERPFYDRAGEVLVTDIDVDGTIRVYPGGDLLPDVIEAAEWTRAQIWKDDLR